MPQRNTPERRDMLAARAADQRRRTLGFTPMQRRPRAHVGVWDPAGPRETMRHLPIVPAWMNRRTGEPHTDDRFKARGHTHDRLHTNTRWEQAYG